MKKEINALLRLFNAVKIEDESANYRSLDIDKRTAQNGYLLDYRIEPTDSLLNLIDGFIGIGGEKLNRAFHKSWGKVANAPLLQLLAEQIAHYITTYGFESIGVYDGIVYIPNEVLEIPEITESIPLIFISGLTKEEILQEIAVLGGGIALSQETLNDILDVVKEEKYEPYFVDDIKNRELHTILCDYYGIVPQEPMQYLRYIISKLTNESLVIKNDYLIGKLKESNGKFLDELLRYAPADLGKIFFRFKPLFLAMKSVSNNKTFFNRLRKSANELHEPINEDYLNSVTAQISHRTFDKSELKSKLHHYSIWRKIRLAYALNSRLSELDSIVYRVRNGRGWVTDYLWRGNDRDTQFALQIVLNSIAQDISPSVSNKIFYIPENIQYSMPATQKQFVGNVPAGTSVGVDRNLLVGVHWYNNSGRVDIDLSLIGLGEKFGWDASYRSYNKDILFSGDVTDARDGASEFFYLKNGVEKPYLLMANYFNFNPDAPVDCQMIVAEEELDRLDKNYIVDPSRIYLSQSVTVNKKQNVVGLIVDNRVYFVGTGIGNSISSRSENMSKTLSFFCKTLVNSIDLADILKLAGGKVVRRIPSGRFVNLSQESLNKNTFLDILQSNP